MLNVDDLQVEILEAHRQLIHTKVRFADADAFSAFWAFPLFFSLLGGFDFFCWRQRLGRRMLREVTQKGIASVLPHLYLQLKTL